ncbi:hypothetical protein [Intestinibacillus massiliensis]|uniref:hypothetical protein n=1 Tax=Intestinibacillus massiliensis TaxID=1871029 RepID=UPI000B34DCB2|nr:hypothetical protein [Intestinibacillus massiliensis]
MKKILTIGATVMIIAALAIGSTLAFLTGKTDALENKFLFDGITLELNEYKDTGHQEAYPEDPQVVYPGAVVDKVPVITVDKGSLDCYVYVQIENGLNTAVDGATTLDISKDWTPIKKGYDIYRYKEVVQKADTAQKLTDIFTKVTVNGEKVTMENIAKLQDSQITIQGFAHQANGTGDTEAERQAFADQAALTYFATPVNP